MTDNCDCAPALSRRSFLTGLAATAGVAALDDGLSTRVAFAGGPVAGDVLVVLSLRGGVDGLSAVAPVTDPAYLAARPTIALQAAQAIQLDQTFGMHPALSPLLPWWRSGELAVVHAVGQGDPSRSHFRAMEEMERAAPGTSLRTGWLDRVLGLRQGAGPLQAVAMGAAPLPQALRGPAPVMSAWDLDSFRLGWIPSTDPQRQLRWSTAMNRLQAGTKPSIAAPARAALHAMATVRTVRKREPDGGHYPATKLGGALRDVARLIKADVGMQLACVDFGNWDMHAGLGRVGQGWMHQQLGDLAAALASFATDLGDQLRRVTVVTLSEFGRRVAENGSGGLDHGHGNAMFLLGGGVVGGRVHGTWPGLAPAGLDAGDLPVTTDYRSVLSEILRSRCGVARTGSVFPGFRGTALGVVRPL
jgi:uncharacterized protein (DUF1501 family)